MTVINYILISVIVGFIIAWLNVKIQSSIALKQIAMGNPEYIAADAFGLTPVIAKTTIVYTVIFSSVLYLFSKSFFIFIGIGGIGFFSIFSLFFLKIAVRNFLNQHPWLNDFSTYYKNTCNEYMKLRLLLLRSNKKSYDKMTQNLWKEIVDLNRRKHVALERIRELQTLKTDVIKLLDKYSYSGDTDKKDRTQKRLRKIEEEICNTETFASDVNEHIKNAETIFLDVKTNIGTGDSERIETDISELTGKVKALEYTVEAMEE